MEGGWRATVRPPRLGGNARMGVFATHSPFRPNPLGMMSLIALKGMRVQGSNVVLELGSLDLVDGTPVVDIKLYLHLLRASRRLVLVLPKPPPAAICRYISR